MHEIGRTEDATEHRDECDDRERDTSQKLHGGFSSGRDPRDRVNAGSGDSVGDAELKAGCAGADTGCKRRASRFNVHEKAASDGRHCPELQFERHSFRIVYSAWKQIFTPKSAKKKC